MTITEDGYTCVENGMLMTAIELKFSNLARRAFDIAAQLSAEDTTPGSRPARLSFAPAAFVPGQSTAPPPT